jgi:hypothetical protein
LLTDVGYSNRLRDLLAHTDHLTFDDLNLLKGGRHFRLDDKTKVIVGRNEEDNKRLLHYRKPEHLHLEAVEVGSPVTLVVGEKTEDKIRLAAAITARYTVAREQAQVAVAIMNNGSAGETLIVRPATDAEIELVALR